MPMRLILILNAGSSSVKCALMQIDEQGTAHDLARGSIDGLGQNAEFSMRFMDGHPAIKEAMPAGSQISHKEALSLILNTVDRLYGLSSLVAAGHRIVHGGPDFVKPVRLNRTNVDELRKLIPLAPLHQPHNLAAVDSLFELLPNLPQVGCFDTAFHATMPAIARNFALPKALTAKGIRRYGFHGISYNYIAEAFAARDPERAKGRVIVAHLGNGASLCGMINGQSVVNTMGFSALDGLMMGTRAGTIDPAVIFYLMREENMSAEAVEKMLYSQSGLLGVSGLSNDMRTLRTAAPDNSDAKMALAMFTYRVIREIGSVAAAMNGVDALVFTAGIGENDSELRADVIKGIGHLGFTLKTDANEQRDFQISASTHPAAFVMPTNEESLIARSTITLL
ncbi:MAG: acetate/propionate family kinase [Alphaproteobacteria bacterium]|nr:acetate/propionate family kinase [Alphaproteobacteria bacterium]